MATPTRHSATLYVHFLFHYCFGQNAQLQYRMKTTEGRGKNLFIKYNTRMIRRRNIALPLYIKLVAISNSNKHEHKQHYWCKSWDSHSGTEIRFLLYDAVYIGI
jgi:hypothetical protein